MKWFRLWWWKYLFEHTNENYSDIGIFRRALCRARNHPYGVIWYDLHSEDPDLHCKYCGDNFDKR